MSKPKILQAFAHRSTSDVRRLTDENLRLLNSYLTIEMISVRAELRKRGMVADIRTELMFNGHQL